MILIDANEVKKAFIGNRYGTKAIEYVIDNAPTVDAEPVVRCKDCRFFYKYGFKLVEYTECTHFDCDVTENGYCWWGERK